MGPGYKITDEDVAALIEANGGNKAAIARKLGVARSTVCRRIDDNPTLQQMIEDAREGMVDNLETKIYSNAMNGDTTALIFMLKTQGKRRGYSERMEVTGPDGKPIQTESTVRIYLPDNGRDGVDEGEESVSGDTGD